MGNDCFFPVRTNSEKKEHLGDEFAEVLLGLLCTITKVIRLLPEV